MMESINFLLKAYEMAKESMYFSSSSKPQDPPSLTPISQPPKKTLSLFKKKLCRMTTMFDVNCVGGEGPQEGLAGYRLGMAYEEVDDPETAILVNKIICT